VTDISLRYLLFGEDKSASSTIKGTGTQAQKTSSIVKHAFAGLGSAIGGPVGEVVDHVQNMFSSLGGGSATMGEKMTGAGVGIAGLGAGLSILGSHEKEAANALEAAIGATGKSYDDYKERIEEVIKEQENYNHSAADTQTALATLTQATKDPAEAMDHMGLVANLAAAQHISLQSAATLVGKAINGSTRVFKQYGIQVSSVSSAHSALVKSQNAVTNQAELVKEAQQGVADVQAKIRSGALTGSAATDALSTAQAYLTKTSGTLATDQAAVVKAQQGVKDATDSTSAGFRDLSSRLDGQASASVDSFSGHLHVLETKVHDQISILGAKFGPVLQATGVGLALVGTLTQIMANRQIMAAAATEAQAAAQATATAATEAETVAQTELDAAMDANPVGLLVIAIAALVAGLVIFFTKTKLGRAIVSGALHDMGAAAGFLGSAFGKLWHGATAALAGVQHGAASTYGWVHDHWPLLLAILTGPFGLATLFIVGHWHQITGAAGSAVSTIHGKLDQLVGFVTGMPGRIDSAAAGMWGGITSSFRSAINGVIDIWNGLSFTVPGVSAFGHHVGGFTISTPDIHHLAAGGTLMSSGSVIVGDRGLEQLTLPAGASVRPLSAREARGVDTSEGGILGVFAVDLRLDGRVVQRLLLKLKRENGGLSLGLA